MFNLSGSELIFLVLIALVVLGPDKLPDAMRKAGKAYADFKRMTSGFQSEMKSVLDEPMRELRETAELAKRSASWDITEKPKSMTMDTALPKRAATGEPTPPTAAEALAKLQVTNAPVAGGAQRAAAAAAADPANDADASEAGASATSDLEALVVDPGAPIPRSATTDTDTATDASADPSATEGTTA